MPPSDGRKTKLRYNVLGIIARLVYWLLGGDEIPVKHALFDTEGMTGSR
ncbi:hypothetical protein Sphch_2549 [Sphingobium chlorophenolicum L-1]|uniref:Uncharacterized protein n=1 Tax=Sphingobium chlorophenolicum L-1 TaxID=690566 RepID=F6EZA4_SPHCR|nr:hypothetical protein Sphch_2549 [Sphingobium chlorophenolicum L-1]